MLGWVVLGFLTMGQFDSFMPENNLPDCFGCKDISMTQDVFDRISDAGLEAYAPEVRARKETLVIYKRWTSSTVNAWARRSEPMGGKVEISMFGGLARQPQVDARGLAIVLCHEMSHLYPVGPNYWKGSESLQMGSEGEADYSATLKCFDRIAKRVPELRKEDSSYEGFVEESCKEEDVLCKNGLVGGKQLANLLSQLGDGKEIGFEDMDLSQVETTISYGYPPVKCRLTSYVYGSLKKDRPGCWKAPDVPKAFY